jgi:histidine ammonia-lyase
MMNDNKRVVILGTGDLTIEDVVGVAARQAGRAGGSTQETRADEAFARLQASRKWVDGEVSRDHPRAIYGINTGFGIKAGSKPLPKEDIPWVSRNLIVSHSTGIGNFLHPEIVRAAMLIRANSLSLGYSGVRHQVVNQLVEMLNRGVIPAIPEYGSVGSSGDLAPLAHLALAFSVSPDEGKRLDHAKHPDNLPADYEDEAGLAYIDQRLAPNAPTALATDGDPQTEYALLNA